MRRESRLRFTDEELEPKLTEQTGGQNPLPDTAKRRATRQKAARTGKGKFPLREPEQADTEAEPPATKERRKVKRQRN